VTRLTPGNVLQSFASADTLLRAWLSAHHAGWADRVMWTVSVLGQAGAIWLLIAAFASVARPRLAPQLWQLALGILLSYLLVDDVLKPLVARLRPFDALPGVRVVGYRPVTYSFPSGHSASAVFGAYIVSLMLPRARAIWWGLAAAIAFSRIYIGVHYPIDVLGGAVVGWAIGVVVTGGRAWYSRESSVAPAGSLRT
jgi:undecaprenyl-diphosphatase